MLRYLFPWVMGCNQSGPKKRQNKLICIVQLLTRGLRCVGSGIFREAETEKAITGIGRARGRDVEELHGRTKTVHVINMLCNKI